MKKILILFLVCFTQNIFSQKKTRIVCKTPKAQNIVVSNDENAIFNLIDIDIKPEFPGGRVKFNHFLDDNYKKSNKRPTIQGKLFATFIIERDGSLNDIKVLHDIGHGTREELIRVLKLSPKWKPGKLKGKKVRTIYSLVFPVQM
ncbi:energy transducer TonB [Flavobacterium limi]|uniref:Transporter n=1 Tax=Flavobacterium limi TaxID=2045105 RepID=A0ABQ1U8L6_9FLAO|nr:energy transducer TonB [Flavobacterium limi]GGF13178.1 transporter [Flavobacterium limi]